MKRLLSILSQVAENKIMEIFNCGGSLAIRTTLTDGSIVINVTI
jgi:hypothetical protein